MITLSRPSFRTIRGTLKHELHEAQVSVLTTQETRVESASADGDRLCLILRDGSRPGAGRDAVLHFLQAPQGPRVTLIGPLPAWAQEAEEGRDCVVLASWEAKRLHYEEDDMVGAIDEEDPVITFLLIRHENSKSGLAWVVERADVIRWDSVSLLTSQEPAAS